MASDPLPKAQSYWDDSFRDYARRVVGRDRTWVAMAACIGQWDTHPGFLASNDDYWIDTDGQHVTGHQAQRHVVDKFCKTCPVQWECARWGVEIVEEVGVYAMTGRDRTWLTAQGGRALALIDTAKRDGVVVAVAVRTARGLAV